MFNCADVYILSVISLYYCHYHFCGKSNKPYSTLRTTRTRYCTDYRSHAVILNPYYGNCMEIV
jgi:hypothetical protein